MKENKLSTVSALMLLAVFAACSVMVLLSGADVYAGIQARDEDAIATRTAQAYVTARIRSYDGAGAIRIIPGEGDAERTGGTLAMEETINDRSFTTLLYVRDGMLCELFMPSDAGLGPEDGEPVLDLDCILFSDAGDGTLRVSIPGREFSVRPRTGISNT